MSRENPQNQTRQAFEDDSNSTVKNQSTPPLIGHHRRNAELNKILHVLAGQGAHFIVADQEQLQAGRLLVGVYGRSAGEESPLSDEPQFFFDHTSWEDASEKALWAEEALRVAVGNETLPMKIVSLNSWDIFTSGRIPLYVDRFYNQYGIAQTTISEGVKNVQTTLSGEKSSSPSRDATVDFEDLVEHFIEEGVWSMYINTRYLVNHHGIMIASTAPSLDIISDAESIFSVEFEGELFPLQGIIGQFKNRPGEFFPIFQRYGINWDQGIENLRIALRASRNSDASFRDVHREVRKQHPGVPETAGLIDRDCEPTTEDVLHYSEACRSGRLISYQKGGNTHMYAYRAADGNEDIVVNRHPAGESKWRVPAESDEVDLNDDILTIPDNWEEIFRFQADNIRGIEGKDLRTYKTGEGAYVILRFLPENTHSTSPKFEVIATGDTWGVKRKGNIINRGEAESRREWAIKALGQRDEFPVHIPSSLQIVHEYADSLDDLLFEQLGDSIPTEGFVEKQQINTENLNLSEVLPELVEFNEKQAVETANVLGEEIFADEVLVEYYLHAENDQDDEIGDGIASIESDAVNDETVTTGDEQASSSGSNTMAARHFVEELIEAGASHIEVDWECLGNDNIELFLHGQPSDLVPILAPIDAIEVGDEAFDFWWHFTDKGPKFTGGRFPLYSSGTVNSKGVSAEDGVENLQFAIRAVRDDEIAFDRWAIEAQLKRGLSPSGLFQTYKR